MSSVEFLAGLKQLIKRIETNQSSVLTEEATKMSFIVPLFQLLGYDVFDSSEFVPEYTADVGTKKGEKVDYAVVINGEPTIIIEAKWCGESLEKHDSQLIRYFHATSAKFAILTNGIIYRFFTDLDDPNKMDEKPFLEINMLDLKDSHINELKKFAKENFDASKIFGSASELKYTNSTKQRIIQELENPSDGFIKFIISDVYDGVKVQRIIDDFRPIIKNAFTQYINELIDERLKRAMESQKASDIKAEPPADVSEVLEEAPSRIITTEEEIQAFYIVKGILSDTFPIESITYKDTESYFVVTFDNNVRKWICRLKLSEKIKYLILPAHDNKTTVINIASLNELYAHKQQILDSAKRFG